jgi:hypothetical protein
LNNSTNRGTTELNDDDELTPRQHTTGWSVAPAQKGSSKKTQKKSNNEALNEHGTGTTHEGQRSTARTEKASK